MGYGNDNTNVQLITKEKLSLLSKEKRNGKG
jgi:hypothetical protein